MLRKVHFIWCKEHAVEGASICSGDARNLKRFNTENVDAVTCVKCQLLLRGERKRQIFTPEEARKHYCKNHN